MINPLERYTANLALQHPWINRTNCSIPLTPLEEVRLYQDKLKIKKLFISNIQLAGFIPGSSLNERYIKKIKDPYSKEPPIEKQEALTDRSTKKFSSVGLLTLTMKEKSFKNSRQQTVGYGNFLNVPGLKTLSIDSPIDIGRKRSLSKTASRSPSPRTAIPKFANKNYRNNSNL